MDKPVVEYLRIRDKQFPIWDTLKDIDSELARFKALMTEYKRLEMNPKELVTYINYLNEYRNRANGERLEFLSKRSISC